MEKKNVFKLVFEVYSHLSQRRKIEFFILIGVTFIFSITEVLSVGALIPLWML